MKQVYRAYPPVAVSLRMVGSVATGALLLVQSFGHGSLAYAAIVASGAFGVGAQLFGLIPGVAVVGDDGVYVRWFWSRTFVRRSEMVSLEPAKGTKIRIVKRDGSVAELVVMRQRTVDAARGELAALMERADAERGEGSPPAACHALAVRVASWAREGEASSTASPMSAAYRSGEAAEQLWEIAGDVDAPALARIGAVHALGPLDAEARARVRVLADATADPLAAAALDAAAAGDMKRMRAVVAVRDVREAALPAAHGGTAHALPTALIHPNRAILALAWLSRLWFVMPAAALAIHSMGAAAVAFVACIFGALPWVAARELDPLPRVDAGRIDVEEGFITRDGERVLDLSRVKAAYIHYRAGAPPVLRLEGRLGWPLLDCRMGSLDEARALLRRLPLTDRQRAARFGTMHPGNARGVLALVVGALVIALGARLGTQAMFALGGLVVGALRVRRLLTVERDALVMLSPWKRRLIPFDEIATVERRAGAGVVVLKSGEQVKLRTVTGELVTVPDDDLTETLMDRLEEHRSASVSRARVAVDPEPVALPETEEDEVTPEEPKRARTLGSP